MIYASVCTGIATDRLAFPKHWQCAWSAEVAAFPSRLLKHHYPETPNLGDMRGFVHKKAKSHGQIRSTAIGLLAGGTPCQSFSVAGKRGGMDDQRGNLALTFARLAGICRPEWVLWENVPGVLSSNGGRDFGAFLGALAERGYHLTYRILDAQWFGLAQRRRRVFVVGHLGDWRRAAAVLFDPASLRRDPPSREGKGKEIAGTLGASANARGWRADLDTSGAFIPELAGTLGACANGRSGRQSLDGIGAYIPEVTGTLTTQCGGGRRDLETETFIPELSHCLTGGGFDGSEDGSGRGLPIVALAENQRGELREMDVIGALGQGGGKPGQGGGKPGQGGGKPGQGYPAAMIGARVRRLMPVECERLQGLPDGYTAIPGATDAERYTAIGNGWPRPVVEWIANRIEIVNRMGIPSDIPHR